MNHEWHYREIQLEIEGELVGTISSVWTWVPDYATSEKRTLTYAVVMASGDQYVDVEMPRRTFSSLDEAQAWALQMGELVYGYQQESRRLRKAVKTDAEALA